MNPSTLSKRFLIVAAAAATVVFVAAPAGAGQRGGGHSVHVASAHYSAPPAQHVSAAPPRVASAPVSRGPVAEARPARVVPPGSTVIGVGGPRTVGVGGTTIVYSSPYYAFRPHFNLGFGLWVGYPVAFPYGYGYLGYGYGSPYGYYDPYAYGYGDPGYYSAAPAPAAAPAPGTYAPNYSSSDYSQQGGMSFDIQPVDAAVFVDGKYVGAANDFGPQQPPLTIPAGRHHVDLRAQGFQTMSFDVTVVAGQVLPYQGSMTVIH